MFYIYIYIYPSHTYTQTPTYVYTYIYIYVNRSVKYLVVNYRDWKQQPLEPSSLTIVAAAAQCLR